MIVFWAAKCGRYLFVFASAVRFAFVFVFVVLGSKVWEIPPGYVEHVCVDWNRTRLIKGHEEDAISNLKDMFDENLWIALHQFSSSGQYKGDNRKREWE